jgi:hypothetical protein
VCYLEWSADAPGLDLDDPAVWLTAHPAVRHAGNPTGTIELEWLVDEHRRDRDSFYRTYLNVPDRAGVTTSPIDRASWDRLAVAGWPRTGPITLAVDTSPLQAWSTLVACGELADGRPVLELLDRQAGIGWCVDRITSLVDRWPVETVAVDRGGPAGPVADMLIMAGVPVTDLGLRELAAAAAGLVEAVRTGQLAQLPAAELDAAVTGARRRPHGDGSWTFSRTSSPTDVSPIVAASLARAVHPAVSAPVPAIH